MKQLECRLENNVVSYTLKEVTTKNAYFCMFANQSMTEEGNIQTLSIELPNTLSYPELIKRYLDELIEYLKKNAGKTLLEGGIFTSERPSYHFNTYLLANKVLKWLLTVKQSELQSEFNLHNKPFSTFYGEAIKLDRIRFHTKAGAYSGVVLPCGAVGTLLLKIALENDLSYNSRIAWHRHISSYTSFHEPDEYETKLMEDDASYYHLCISQLLSCGFIEPEEYYFTKRIRFFTKVDMDNPLIQRDLKERELIILGRPDPTI